MVNHRVLTYPAGGFEFREVTAEASEPLAEQTTCPIKGAALILSNGGGEEFEEAMLAFEKGGLDMETLSVRGFGNRRNILIVDETQMRSEN